MKCSRCGGSGEEPVNGNLAAIRQRERDDAAEVLRFLNEKAERNFQPTRVNMDFITGRLREGATLIQCKAIISRKVAAWKDDPRMAPFLRPSTLFNATKFSQYQGELPASAFEKCWWDSECAKKVTGR